MVAALVFDVTSNISPLANFFAVPVVALGVVPLTLLALVLPTWTNVGHLLLESRRGSWILSGCG